MKQMFLFPLMLLFLNVKSQEYNSHNSFAQSIGRCSNSSEHVRTYKEALLENLVVVMTQHFSENSVDDSTQISAIDADLTYSLPDLFAVRYGAEASTAMFLAGFLDILYADYSATTTSSDHLVKIIGLVRAGEFDAARFEASLLIISSLPSDFFPFDPLDLTEEQYDILSNVIQSAFNSIRQETTPNQFEVYLNLKVGSTLSFAMDTTGSMAGEIEAAKQRTISIIESTRGTLQQPLLYVLSPFNDPETGPVSVTTDSNVMISALNALFAFGGGDFPEKALTGIQDAILASTRRSVVFMITDAPAKDVALENRVIALAVIRKIRIFSLLTQALPYPTGLPLYNRISRASGGLVTVTDKSSIGSITTLFTTLTQQGQVKLLIFPTSSVSQVSFVVDSTLTSVTILLSAQDGSVSIDRIEHESEERVNITTEVDSVGLSINRIIPNTGVYTLYFSGNLNYSLEISGLSTFGVIPVLFENVDGNFIHRLQPRAGSSARIVATIFGNYPTEEQLISSTQTRSAVVERVFLTDEGGNIIERISMEQCGEENEYRTSNAFQVPTRRFFIQLIGTDRLGFPFTRTDPCAVTPLASDISFNSINDQIVDVGNTVMVETTITNNETSPIFFRLDVSDSRRFVTISEIPEFTLNAGEARIITLTITVPTSLTHGSTSVVTITATPRNSKEFIFTTFNVIAHDQAILTCPASLSPSGSIITCTDLNNIGSMCTLTCEPEYIPVGAVERTCLSNQTWTASEFTCKFIGSSECRITGDPHYLTFDGKAFDFQGTCVYTTVKTLFDEPQNGLEPFSIQTENQHLGGNTRVSWFRRAYIYIYNRKFMFFRNYKVTVDDVSIIPPYNLAEKGLRIALSGGNIELTTRFGLRIVYNGEYNFFIHLSGSYSNLVEGLCGDFNQDSANDLALASNKSILVNENDFGNNYKIDDLAEGCSSPSSIEGDCLDRDGYELRCEILNSECFADCREMLSTIQVFQNCVFDLCATNGDELAYVQSISEYAESCQEAGLAICDWREYLQIPVTCRLNAHYEHEGTSCPNTCQFPTQSTRCGRPVKSGCVCDDGFVLSGLECVSRTECGCTVDGRYYKHGDEVFNCTSLCTCNGGAYGCVSASCQEGESCEISQVTRQMACLPLSTSQFIATGDPHYTTLDGLNYDFQGACSYVVATLDDPTDWFTIVSENENRGGNELVSNVKTATVYFQNDGGNVSVKLGSLLENKPYAKIEGISPEPVFTDLYESAFFEIYRSGQSIVMEFRNIKINYIKDELRVILPVSYARKVKGLAGNFNGNPDDDLVTKNGTTTSDVNEFATSYQYGDCETPEPPLPFVCSPEDTALYGDTLHCGLIREDVFAACAATGVDIETTFDNCVYDVCANDGSIDILHERLGRFSQQCRILASPERSIPTDVCNWRSELDAPTIECPENSHYEGCASPCPNSCLKPDAEESCSNPLVEGCACNFGYILNEGGECIRREDCGCFTDAGYRPRGYMETDSNCMQKCTCRGPNAYECQPINCSEEESCSFTGSTYECVPPQKTCVLWGASYVSTFDHKQFNFNGTCTYVLASFNGSENFQRFRVMANKASARDDGLQGYELHLWIGAFIKDDIRRKAYNMRIASNARDVYVDDIKVLPGTGTPDYIILQQGMFTVIQFHFGLLIHTGKDFGSIMVTIPGSSELEGKMYGLCGTADGNPDNEFDITVNESLITRPPSGFGNTKRRNVTDEPRCTDGKDHSALFPTSCQNRPIYQLLNGTNSCGRLINSSSLLATCHDTVAPQTFFAMCVHSACKNPNYLKVLQESIAGYRMICKVRKDPIGTLGSPLSDLKLNDFSELTA